MWLGLGKAVLAIFNTVLTFLPVWVGYRLGIHQEQASQLKKSGKIQNEQLRIAAQAPVHRSALLKRMLKRKRRD